MYWHLLATTEIVLVASELMGHLLDREAAPEESSSLTVLWEDQVSVIQSGRGTDTGCFFTKLGHVEGNTHLALGSIVN